MKFFFTLAVGGVLAVGCLFGQAQAQNVFLDTDFTAAEGFADGKLQFQNGWLGQTSAQVDSTGTGTVSLTGTFERNVYNMGALGGTAGGDGSGETGAGFKVGDKLKIEHKYAVTLGSAQANLQTLDTGFRENFVTGSFEAAPRMGQRVAYNPFEAGTFKVFSNFARAGFNGADNPFAMFVTSAQVGIDNGYNAATMAYDLPTDLVSDKLRLTFETEYKGSDTWQATEMIVENLDTATVLATASIDKPAALEEVTLAGLGSSEVFYAIRHSIGATNTTSVTDAIKVTYTAAAGIDGDFDADDDVDSTDFLLWQRGYNTLTAADLQGWQTNYGTTPAVVAVVPEPSTTGLCVLAGMALGCLVRGRD